MAQSLTRQFEAWVRTQPADDTYEYGDTCGCAFGRFLVEAGFVKEAAVGGSTWDDGSLPMSEWKNHRIPPVIANALVREDWTFGALAQRLAIARESAL